VIELLDKFTFEGEENTVLFRLLANTLDRLNRGDAPHIVVRYYEIRLLDLLGFRPELQHCVVCDEKIKAQDQFFSASLGGVVCPDQGSGLVGAVPVSARALKYLRHFQRSSYQEATRAMILEATQHELEVLMQYYITYLLERGLNTPAFLRRVRRDNDNSLRSEEVEN
jgi:DNA repair protein RecO (recombination protein O)